MLHKCVVARSFQLSNFCIVNKKPGSRKGNRVGGKNKYFMITLKVTVNGGKAPKDILVHIENLKNTHDISYTKPNSFNQDHDLPSGEYVLIVTGMNPNAVGANTEISITGDFSTAPVPKSPVKKATQIFSAAFYFII